MDKSLTALQDRKETVLAKIEAQGKLTDQLKAAIEAAENWQMWKNSTFPIRKNAAPRRRLPVKRVFSPWLVLSCKIVQTSRLKLKSWHLKPFQQLIRLLLVLWIFWLRPFLRTIAYALGPTTKSGTTVTSLQPSGSIFGWKTFKIYYDFEDKMSKLQGYLEALLRWPLSPWENAPFLQCPFQTKNDNRKSSANLSRRK